MMAIHIPGWVKILMDLLMVAVVVVSTAHAFACAQISISSGNVLFIAGVNIFFIHSFSNTK